jgi:hypothetical protein
MPTPSSLKDAGNYEKKVFIGRSSFEGRRKRDL